MRSVTVRTKLGSVHRLRVEAADQRAAVRMVAEHFRRCGWRVLGQWEKALLVCWDR